MTTIVTTDVVNGTATDASVMNNNFSSVKSVVNGGIDNSNIAASAAIAVSKLAAGSDDQILRTVAGVPTWSSEGAGSEAMPAGSLIMYGGAAAPTGWLLCNGDPVSRTGYSDLFTAIGTSYGAGDGSSTFNVPDLRGRIPVGKGSNTSVDALGENEGVTEANRRPQHKHTPHQHTVRLYSNAGTGGPFHNQGYNDEGSARYSQTEWTDGGSGVSTDSLNAPAYLVVNYIIKT